MRCDQHLIGGLGSMLWGQSRDSHSSPLPGPRLPQVNRGRAWPSPSLLVAETLSAGVEMSEHCLEEEPR